MAQQLSAPHGGLLGVLAYVEGRIAALKAHFPAYQYDHDSDEAIDELETVRDRLAQLAEVVQARESAWQADAVEQGNAGNHSMALADGIQAKELRWMLGQRPQREGSDERAG